MGFWDRILGRQVAATDAPAEPLSKPEPARHNPTWSGTQWVGSTSWTNALTPERLASYLRQASDGDPRAQAELIDEIVDKDLHLGSVLATRKRAVAGLDWTVNAASDKRTDQRIAAFVQDTLAGISNIESAFIDLLDAVPKGYSACEIDWRVAPGRVWAEQLLYRPQSWFRPDSEVADRWRILTEQDSVYGEQLRPGAWIWHEAKAKSGSTAAGSALGRPLAWGYLFKTFTLKDWVIFAEIYGAPIRVGKYRQGTSEADMATLFNALKALGVDAAAMLPEGVSIEFVQAASTRSSPEVYEKLVGYVDAAFSKAVLGQTLTTEQGSSGARAMAVVHNEVRHDLLVSDARQLARTLTRDLVRPLVEFQFGPQPRYPAFVFQTDPPEDLNTKADLYTKLQELGVRFPVDHVHQVFGVPLPGEGEATYGAPSPRTQEAPQAPPARPRLPFLNEDRPDYRALAELPPLPAESERAIRDALRSGGEDAWKEIIRHLESWIGKAEESGQVSEMLVKAVETLDLQPFADKIADGLITSDLIGRIQVRDNGPVGDWPKVPPSEAMGWWSQKARMLPGDFGKLSASSRSRAFTCAQFTSLQAVDQVHQAISLALEKGESLGQFKDRYNALLLANGMSPQDPWHVENVFRTNMGTAYSVGRHTSMVDPEVLAERPFWMYDGVDDHRTRPTHKAMHGKVYPANHPIWQTWYPPNGFQCRCMVHALTADEVRSLGLTVEQGWPTYRYRGTGPERPNVPDPGFQRNPALEPHQFDFSVFPPQYLVAMGIAP